MWGRPGLSSPASSRHSPLGSMPQIALPCRLIPLMSCRIDLNHSPTSFSCRRLSTGRMCIACRPGSPFHPTSSRPSRNLHTTRSRGDLIASSPHCVWTQSHSSAIRPRMPTHSLPGASKPLSKRSYQGPVVRDCSPLSQSQGQRLATNMCWITWSYCPLRQGVASRSSRRLARGEEAGCQQVRRADGGPFRKRGRQGH